MIAKITSLSGYLHEYQKSIANPTGFWANIAETFFWRKKWDKILSWDFDNPKIEWFKGGKLNITENIFERHLFQRGEQTALIWEPNDPREASKKYTYEELFLEVKSFANVLR
ncbi:MAG: acetyl-coenzyme A synthetase, partial [Bacteroidales bacterium]|nr:acetyl-coenzyme A synthetase [Bacteroidales bacterium]